ncbi:hypothetical protein K435DRAFT_960815 [Dendrothele bispora CBS 962.96]|uniref:Thioredoxin-like fold domain-containing protein n=1 Tax=Dendrothele bispora (strain CBS 962.96) TaxID=1314807 RepID=A0A4S8MT24_DENBC|nr:hypothetical protein K435DRAFT_960815 [Dendrothele bispora CBS 962.96]
MFIVTDILSLLPSWSSAAAEPPEVGQKAPNVEKLTFPLDPAHPVLLYFPRHCGCPYPERDLNNLVTLLLSSPPIANSDFQIIVLPHANSEHEATRWLDAVLNSSFQRFEKSFSGDEKHLEETWNTVVRPKFALLPDTDRSIAKSYGLGNLPSFTSLLGKGGLTELSRLRSQGIVNRRTAPGSDRWAAHGSCWVDAEGIVRYYEKGEEAHMECNWKAGLYALGFNTT